MTRPTRTRTTLAASVATLLAALLTTLAPNAVAAGVGVSPGTLSGSGPTTISLSGSGFQSIRGAFGGIYVFFGVVSGSSWRPSQGWPIGVSYRYLPDSESSDNAGRQRFVAFPGSDTESSANGGVISAAGTWSTSLNVPGPVITVTGRDGSSEQIDCRRSTCGVITVGAHGVVNARNESFTPVRFAAASSGQGSTSQGSTDQSTDPGSGETSQTPSASSTKTPSPTAKPKLTVDRATAVQGRVLSFIATGFRPGEQVGVTLDDGLAAIGPLGAGASGELAGVLQLPSSVGQGTHRLRLTGAASGIVIEELFPVRVDAATTTTPAATAASTAAPVPAAGTTAGERAPAALARDWPAVAFVAVAATVLLACLLGSIWLLRRRRQTGPGVGALAGTGS